VYSVAKMFWFRLILVRSYTIEVDLAELRTRYSELNLYLRGSFWIQHQRYW